MKSIKVRASEPLQKGVRLRDKAECLAPACTANEELGLEIDLRNRPSSGWRWHLDRLSLGAVMRAAARDSDTGAFGLNADGGGAEAVASELSLTSCDRMIAQRSRMRGQ
jgi:hypothetical protein